jgi:hypothetical protein
MESHWNIICATTQAHKAEKWFGHFVEQIEREATLVGSSPAFDGTNIRLTLTVSLQCTRWPDAVFELIQLAQRVGSHWQLLGFIENDLTLLSNKPRIGGLVMIEGALWQNNSSGLKQQSK